MSSNKTSVILNFESEKAPKIEHFDHKLEDDIKFNEELNSIAITLVMAICGSNYKRKYERYVD